LVQAFLKKWWVESDFKAPTSRSHYGSKVPAVTVTVFKYRNKIGKHDYQYQDIFEKCVYLYLEKLTYAP
jgi:hypothetical protein